MWWKTFYDPTETDWVFRRNSMGGIWTVLWLVALCAFMGILGPAALPHLVMPVALCGLYIFLSYVTGVVGMAILAPLLAYGWLCLGWLLAYGYPAVGSTLAQLEGLVVALLVVTFLIGAPHVRANLLIPVVAEGFFYVCLSWGIFWLIAPEPELLANYAKLDQLMHRMVDFYFVGVNVISAIVLVIVLIPFARDLPRHPEVRRQLLWDAGLFGVGCALTAVAALVSRLLPLLGMLVLLVGYAGVAVYARRQRVEQVAWAVVPLVVLGTVAAVAAAPVEYLPSYGPGTALVLAVHDGVLGSFARASVLPLLEGLSTLMGGLAAQLVHGGLALLAWVGGYLKVIIEPVAIRLAMLQSAYGGGAGAAGMTDELAEALAPSAQNELGNAGAKLAWQMIELPQDSLLCALLCLFLCTFAVCVVVGTIQGVADVRRLPDAEDSNAAKAPSQVTSVGPVATLPRWFTFDGVRDLSRRAHGDVSDEPDVPGELGAETDTAPQAVKSPDAEDGAAPVADGAPQDVTSASAPEDERPADDNSASHAASQGLRSALGLPARKRPVRQRRWDEQLSGQAVGRAGATISAAEKLRLENRRAKPVGRPGLWWKVFEDDGRREFIPKSDIFGTLLTVVPALMALRLAGADNLASTVVPLLCILLNWGAVMVMGLVGTVAMGPALVYGWSAVAWCLKVQDLSYVPGMGALDGAVRGFAVLVILSFFTPAMRRAAGGTISLAFAGFGVAWMCARRYAVGYWDEVTVRTYLGYVYAAALLFALVFTLWGVFKQIRLVQDWPEARAEERKCMVLALAGVLPLVVAYALSGAGSVVALLGATVCYVALAMAGRLHGPKGLSWPLFALMACAVLGAVSRAETGMMPVAVASDVLMAVGRGPVADVLGGGAWAELDGFAALFGRAVGAVLVPVLGLASASELPAELLATLCLYPGVLVLASVMGVGVSLLEAVRPQLVADQLAAEAQEAETVSEAEPETVPEPESESDFVPEPGPEPEPVPAPVPETDTEATTRVAEPAEVDEPFE